MLLCRRHHQVAFAIKFLTLGSGFAEALVLECEPVGVVHQAIEDGVGGGDQLNFGWRMT
jgi:hypothetical protein